MPPKGGQDSRVEAMVRVRPFNRRELELVRKENDGVCKPIVHMSGRRVALLNHEDNFRELEAFDFDEAFWSIPREQMGMDGMDMDDEVTQKVMKQMGIDHIVGQQEVFEKSGAHLVQHAFDGYHSCIFAYGQTGAGKTFTMMGGLDEKGGLDESPKGRENRGLCLRLVEDLFRRIEEYREKGDKTVFKVFLSFIEIYKEKCKDLLVKPGAKKKTTEEQEKDYADLKVRHTPAEGTYVQGARRVEIKTAKECFNLMGYGMGCRHTAPTKMNDVSSRSHAIFQITFKQHDALKGTNTISNINMVDLAGSERIKMSGAEGQRLDEATKINKSLSTLRRVIDVLIDNAKLKKGQQKSVPPYRESMLTWLLMESLGGNSKTIMVAAVSPFYGNCEDTLNTLRYANKAKEIVCKVKRNDEQGAVMVAAMRAEMDRLRSALLQKSEEQDEAVRAQLESELQEAEEQFKKAQDEYESVKEAGEEMRKAAEALQSDVAEKAAAADELKQMRLETEMLQQQRAAMEQDAIVAQRQAEELQLNVKEQEENIRATQAEKERLQREEAELRAKEQVTREEMKITKQRQFAIAFKNAVQLWKDKVFLERLSGQQQSAAERLQRMQEQLAEKKAEHDSHELEHRVLTDRHREAQSRVDELHREHQAEIAKLDADIKVHTERKAAAHREHAMVDEQYTTVQKNYDEMVRKLGSFEESADAEATRLEAEIAAAQAEEKQAGDELRSVERQLEQKSAEVEGLKAEVRQWGHDYAETKKDHDLRKAQVDQAAEQSQSLRRQLDSAKGKLAAAEAERAARQAEIDSMSEQIKKIDRNHRDLKSFVENRFFPPSSGQDADRPAASPSRREMRQQTPHTDRHTLKSKHRAEHLTTQVSRRGHSQEQTGPRATTSARVSGQQTRPAASDGRRSPATGRRGYSRK